MNKEVSQQTEEEEEIRKLLKDKSSRFERVHGRWFLAYKILDSYHLFVENK